MVAAAPGLTSPVSFTISASTVVRWASVSVSPLTPLRNVAAAAAADDTAAFSSSSALPVLSEATSNPAASSVFVFLVRSASTTLVHGSITLASAASSEVAHAALVAAALGAQVE